MSIIKVLGGTSLLALMSATAVHAQEANANEQANSDEIVVTGFRSSLADALSTKRRNSSIVEAISSEDIGDLPDVTIADSLTRLPGVAAERDRGQASTLSIRGLGPRLSFATINGRESITAQTGRTVAYDQFPSELIYAAEVYKSPDAKLVEGGIAGTVNLRTVRPLDFSERKISLAGGYVYHPKAEAYDDIDSRTTDGFRGSATYVDQFMDGKLGISLGVSTQDQPDTVNGFFNFDDFQGPIDIDGNGTTEIGTGGFDSFAVGGVIKRQGAIGTVQFQPSDNLNLTFDAFYTLNDIDEATAEFFNFPFPAFDYTGGIEEGGFIVAGNYLADDTGNRFGGAGASFASAFDERNEILQFAGNLEWNSGPWDVTLDLSQSDGERESRFAAIQSFVREELLPVSVTFDIRGDNPSLSTNINLADPNNFIVDSLVVTPQLSTDSSLFNGRLDITRNMNGGWLDSFDFGGRYSNRKNTNSSLTYSQSSVIDVNGDGVIDDLDRAIPTDIAGVATNGSLDYPAILTFDFEEAATRLFGGVLDPSTQSPTNNDLSRSGSVNEKTLSVYAKANFQGEFGATPYSGNFGVRVVDTDVNSIGTRIIGGTPEVSNISNDYFEVLPSANITFELSDDKILRFAASRALARPPIEELQANLSFPATVSDGTSAEAGNPFLNPYIANQLDVAYEWYFADEALFSVSAFYKDLSSNIGRDSVDIDVSDLQSVLPNFITTVAQPVNGEGGDLWGFEVLYQQPFTFLPAPFDGFGVTANYSYNDTNVTEFVPADNPVPIAGLSKHVFSGVGYYQKDGFEARLAYNYRSDFSRIFRGITPETEDGRGIWDMSMSYDVSDNFQLQFQIQNLNNYKERSYRDNQPLDLNRFREFSRRLYVGGRLNF